MGKEPDASQDALPCIAQLFRASAMPPIGAMALPKIVITTTAIRSRTMAATTTVRAVERPLITMYSH